MSRVLREAALILAWWLLGGVGSRAFGQQYPFLPVDGSPKGVTNLFQDSRGRIWLAGAQLSCFDGTRFFSLADYGLPQGAIYDVSEDPSGAIWIGSDNGVYRFGNGIVEQIAKGVAVSVIGLKPDMAIALVGPAGRGTPMFSAALMRMRQVQGKWVTQTVMDLDSGGALTRDHNGMLLYPRRGAGWGELRLDQIMNWRPGVAIQVIQHPLAGYPTSGKLKVIRDRAGCVWEGAEGGNIYDCGDGRREAPFAEGPTMDANLHEAADGTMVLEGFNVLAVGRPGSFRLATPANGLRAPQDTLPAVDGTIWVANKQGLFRFASPYRIEYWTARDGLPSAPWSVARTGGRIYAGLDNQIAVLNKDRLRWDITTTFKERGEIPSLVGEPDGALMAGIMYGGVARVEPDGRVSARTLKGQVGSVMRLGRTSDGEVWVGGEYLGRLKREVSVLKFEKHEFRAPRPNWANNDAVLSIKYQEGSRRLFACFNRGLAIRDERGSWTEITGSDGLKGLCWSFAPLPNGDVWYKYYALPSFALIRPTTDGRFTVREYSAENGVADAGGDGMEADHRGWIWRSGGAAMYVADDAEAEAGNWLQIDQADGFPGNGMNSGSVFVDDDGSLWWGAENDVVHYTPPPDLVQPQFAPQVYVSAFSWDNNAPRMAEAVAAVPHGSKITAHIGSLQFDRRNALRLRYRILPGQPSWRETRSLDLALGTLSSGRHTLEVQGRVFTGPWSATERRTFAVLTPVLLTWPLLAVYFAAATGLAGGGYLLRRRRKIDEAALLPDLAAFRMSALLPEVYELTGTLLGGSFEVGELLARGGFANVFSGYDRDKNRRCAVKIFRGELKNKNWIERRFEQEVAALRRIGHPNVVSIYADGWTPTGAPYLVMEFVEGRNLREMLSEGALSPRRTARLLRQLASALDAIHGQDICHRDVKPENIIIRQEVMA